MNSTWDSDLYLRFADERTQPAVDLCARIHVDRAERIVDLGCGPGNSTAVLKARWPGAKVVGIDNSQKMLDAARARDPGGEWRLADLRDWEGRGAWDVVFSNATFQWVPDHQKVFPRLVRAVRKGGVLAIQMPQHFESPMHRVKMEIARYPKWCDRLTGATSALWMGGVGFYYDLLRPIVAKLDIWETDYIHVMAGPEAILDWVSGTALRPFLTALATDGDRAEFRSRMLDRLTAAYPRQSDGRVLFPFRRIFMIAVA